MCFCKMNILLYGMKNAMPFKCFYVLRPTQYSVLCLEVSTDHCNHTIAVSLFRSILKWRSTPFPLPLLPPKLLDLLQVQLLQHSYPVKGRLCILLLAALSKNLL